MIETIIDDVDFGPLALLPGTWRGEKGMDIAPEEDGSKKENPFSEEIVFEIVGDVTNAGKQTLGVVRYHQKVYHKKDGQQFHDQLGYWVWDPAAGTVMFTLTIPRAVSLVAGGDFDIGSMDDDAVSITVESEEGGDWGVAQSPFMRDNAKTTGFKINLEVDGDKMSYSQTTFLDIYGRKFDHTDNSTLVKV
ncbi:MAG: FABP family protein [Oceanicoccus sp.]|uniref:heme-binding beta-barrel domain-containing protein n=1 Tax=Oceanicoccus sp. TaxID=2691044 RepID=UPI0026157294|nr:heme-binding beta-barrel domain-containing protein [Oceanicoccus sp.]MCP3908863.1 FABP family protein [Oceanicoccus sp.]MDG1771854.1 heme-binding beta-barrel domain-containing protein [Oceanicoccus sp.]